MEIADHAIIRRMDAELNDYPGAGANNHHTPGHPQKKNDMHKSRNDTLRKIVLTASQ